MLLIKVEGEVQQQDWFNQIVGSAIDPIERRASCEPSSWAAAFLLAAGVLLHYKVKMRQLLELEIQLIMGKVLKHKNQNLDNKKEGT